MQEAEMGKGFATGAISMLMRGGDMDKSKRDVEEEEDEEGEDIIRLKEEEEEEEGF